MYERVLVSDRGRGSSEDCGYGVSRCSKGTGHSSGYGYGFVGGHGYGYFRSSSDGSLQYLGRVGGYSGSHEVWFHPVFEYASIGCTTLSLNEWRERWRELAAGARLDVNEAEASMLFRLAKISTEETACKT